MALVHFPCRLVPVFLASARMSHRFTALNSPRRSSKAGALGSTIFISVAALLLIARLPAPDDQSQGAGEKRDASDNVTGGPALISALPEERIPAVLAEQSAQVLAAGKTKATANMTGRDALSSKQLQRLQELPRLLIG